MHVHIYIYIYIHTYTHILHISLHILIPIQIHVHVHVDTIACIGVVIDLDTVVGTDLDIGVDKVYTSVNTSMQLQNNM